MAPGERPRRRGFLGLYPLLCGGVAVLAGGVVLAGWWLDLPRLTTVMPGLPPMVPNTALMTVLLGASVILLAPAGAGRSRRIAGWLCAAAAGLVAGLTLAEYALGLDLRIDELLVATREAPGGRHPRRTSPQTSVTAFLVSVALLALDWRTAPGRRPAELLALVSGLIPLVALLGYLFGVAALYGSRSLLPYTGMSIPSAVAMLVLVSGLLAARADSGVLSILTAQDSGGLVARRLLAGLLVLAPVVFAIALGARMGVYTPAVAAAVIVLVGLIGTTTFLFLLARRLSQAEASRSRLASLVSSSDDAIIAKTPEGVITDWNSGAERMYGYPAAEMIGQSVFRLVPPERVDELKGILESIRRREGTRSLETVRLRKDGSRFPALVTISPIVDGAGRLLGASTITHDISARKRAEEALRLARDAEQHLRAELEKLGRASGAVSEALADLPQSDVSAVLSMIALQARSLTQADYVALGIGTDPEKPFHPWIFLGMSQEVVKALGRFPRPVGTLGRVARYGEITRVDDIHRHPRFRGLPPGHPELGSFLGVPIHHRGRPVGNLYLAHRPGRAGFTEQDERLIRMLASRVASAIETAILYAEENLERAWLQSIIDQMPDAVLLYDEQGRLKAMNQAAAALPSSGGGRADPLGSPALTGPRPPGAAIPAEQRPVVRVLRHQEVLVREEMLLGHNGGEPIPIAVSATPVRDAAGKLSGAMVIVQDISERKQLERLREEWSAVVAHDLRQPVSTISLAAESLLRFQARDLPEKAQRSLERIRSASGRLNRMISDLLDVSRIESKRLEIECRPADLRALIGAAVDGLGDAAAGHELQVTAPPGEEVWVDPDRIHQVLGNLISNAAKHGEPGTEISIQAVPRDGEVEVIVSNRGPGIPPELLGLLFSRFARSRGARERRTPGLGLGLYIARGLVEAHGGRIWAESRPGEITRFHFTVPRVPRPPLVREEPAAPPAPA